MAARCLAGEVGGCLAEEVGSRSYSADRVAAAFPPLVPLSQSESLGVGGRPLGELAAVRATAAGRAATGRSAMAAARAQVARLAGLAGPRAGRLSGTTIRVRLRSSSRGSLLPPILSRGASARLAAATDDAAVCAAGVAAHTGLAMRPGPPAARLGAGRAGSLTTASARLPCTRLLPPFLAARLGAADPGGAAGLSRRPGFCRRCSGR